MDCEYILKRNVKTIDNALDAILQLEGVQYELMKHPFDTSDRERSAKDEFDRVLVTSIWHAARNQSEVSMTLTHEKRR